MFRTAPGEARALIEDWIYRPALRELVEAFGGTWPEGNLEHVIAQLAEFSKIWDYRSGESRIVFHDDTRADDPYAALTYRAAKELGLVNPAPPSENEYDYLLILGGLATGVEPRVKYAAKLVGAGLKIRKQIAGLGSFRPLHDKELPISRRYAPEGRYEIDHLAAMMAAFFGGECTPSDPHIKDPRSTAAIWHMYSLNLGLNVAAYAAVSSQPDLRPANTADTYELFAESTNINPASEALLVTSAIYAPYQHIDSTRVFGPIGVTVETIGVAALQDDGTPTHPPHAYRQEIRSAIRSIRQIY